MARKVAVAAAAAAVVFPLLTACGAGFERGVLNLYIPGTDAVPIGVNAERCNDEAGGDYEIVARALPKGADDQRLQLARRLAGNDASLDLMVMDVVWTAEFADAGWMVPVPEEIATPVREDTMGGPLDTVTWQSLDDDAERLYAVPFSANTQLLWYRKDVVRDELGRDSAATTWDQVVADAQASRAEGGPAQIMVQGNRYEGLTVWFNSVLASAGGQVVDPDDPSKVTLNDTREHRAATVRALEAMKAVATAPGRDPSLTNSDEASARLGMERGNAIYQVNWPFVFAGMQEQATAGEVPFLQGLTRFAPLFADDYEATPAELAELNTEMQKSFDFAPYPGFDGLPAKTTLGGLNIAVASTSEQPDLAFEALSCLTNMQSQLYFAFNGGQPPVLEAAYDDPSIAEAYPMAEVIKLQLEAERSTVRPKTPHYQAISILLQDKLSPVGDWEPEVLVDELAEAVQRAIDGEGIIP